MKPPRARVGWSLFLTFVIVVTAASSIAYLRMEERRAQEAEKVLLALRLDVAQMQDIPWGAAPEEGADPATVSDELIGAEEEVLDKLEQVSRSAGLPGRQRILNRFRRGTDALWVIYHAMAKGREDLTGEASNTAAVELAKTDALMATASDRLIRQAEQKSFRAKVASVGLLLVLFSGFAAFFVRSTRQRRQLQNTASELATARDAALAASRHKSEFLATMSHEIRTPLNGVIGLNDLMLRTPLDAHQQRLATGAQVAGRTLLGVINDILDFSKIEAGRLQLELVDFEVRPVFDGVANLLAEAAHAKGLELNVSCHPDVPDHLNGDPTRLGQVILNLGSNAVKFTEEGEVSVRATAESLPDGGTLLRVEVADTGVGIDAARRAGIFDAFAQADASTTRQYGGTGLGLAISREIVTALGGQIGVESSPGKGSTFWFTARLGAPVSAPAAAATPSGLAALSGRRILVVDDNTNNRLILSECLCRWDVRPATASTASSALAQLKNAAAQGDPFDAALLDLVMPGQDGLELAVMIRAEAALEAMPLILLTSSLATDDAVQDAAIDCLTKPVLAGDLLDALLRVFPGSEPADRRTPSMPGAGAAGHEGAPPVLVVEDNAVNQLVAQGLLEALGYTAVTATDGVEAVEKWRSGSFAVVLMDVQMPRMDGYEATRAIRELEPEGQHVPVVALTAAAVEGEREKCLAAGMDDFLPKPISPEALAEVLDRWLVGWEERRDEGAPSVGSDRSEPSPDPLDRDRLDMLRDLIPGSTAYLDKAIDRFVAGTPAALSALRSAVSADDAGALAQAAHKLKGSATNLGLVEVGELAQRLEDLGDAGGVAAASGPLDELDVAVERAVSEVVAYQRDCSRAAAV